HHSSPYRHLSLLPSPRSCNLCPPPGNSHPFPTRRSSDLLLTDQGLRIFAGMETDIAEGGHILCMGVPEEILELNKRLEPHKEKDTFLPFEKLRDLFDEYHVIVVAGHPFREGGHIPKLPLE